MLKLYSRIAAAIASNGRLRRTYQPDNAIKALKTGGDPHKFVWTSPQVFKHMNNTYTMKQRATGIFGSSRGGRDGMANEQRMYFFSHTENASLLLN